MDTKYQYVWLGFVCVCVCVLFACECADTQGGQKQMGDFIT